MRRPTCFNVLAVVIVVICIAVALTRGVLYLLALARLAGVLECVLMFPILST